MHTKRVWCVECLNETPSIIKKADRLIPIRIQHYKPINDDSAVDNRVVGICKECLKSKNEFQQKNAQPVNVKHKHLIFGKF